MSYEYKDSFGTTYMLHCEKGRYARDGSIALCMIVDEEVYDDDGEIECYRPSLLLCFFCFCCFLSDNKLGLRMGYSCSCQCDTDRALVTITET